MKYFLTFSSGTLEIPATPEMSRNTQNQTYQSIPAQSGPKWLAVVDQTRARVQMGFKTVRCIAPVLLGRRQQSASVEGVVSSLVHVNGFCLTFGLMVGVTVYEMGTNILNVAGDRERRRKRDNSEVRIIRNYSTIHL